LAPTLYLDAVAAYNELGPREIETEGAIIVKISARNILKGTIIEVVKGATTSHVRIDIGGATVTAAITNEAVADLKLETGKQAYAVVKASDVMVGID
jgi:molybdopterin-binding protein